MAALATSQIKLIALDLDGSSLNEKSKVSPRTKRAIAEAIRQGYLVVPATGRSFYRLREDVIGVDGIRYVISAGGGQLVDGESNEVLLQSIIPRAEAARLAEDLMQDCTNIYLHRADGKSSPWMGCRSVEEYERWFLQPGWPNKRQIVTSDIGRHILQMDSEVLQLGAYFYGFDGFSAFDKLLAQHYPQLGWFQVADNAVEFSPKGVSKAAALRHLCAYLGLELGQVCAVGDNGNDVEMLRIVGLGAAMGNAIDAAKQAANLVIGRNDEDGVAQFLETYLLNV